MEEFMVKAKTLKKSLAREEFRQLTEYGSKTDPLPGRMPGEAFMTALDAVEGMRGRRR
jgi:hypothetical protein